MLRSGNLTLHRYQVARNAMQSRHATEMHRRHVGLPTGTAEGVHGTASAAGARQHPSYQSSYVSDI